MFPENLVQACFQQVKTVYKKKEDNISPASKEDEYNITTMATTTLAAIFNNTQNATNTTEPEEMERDLEFQNGMNVLGRK